MSIIFFLFKSVTILKKIPTGGKKVVEERPKSFFVSVSHQQKNFRGLNDNHWVGHLSEEFFNCLLVLRLNLHRNRFETEIESVFSDLFFHGHEEFSKVAPETQSTVSPSRKICRS